MSRRTTFIPYRPKTILNKSKRVDDWFWTRYSAYPYIGCQHGCEFCYCREKKYSPYEDLNDFAYNIKVKENASMVLRRALSRVPVDPIFTGDYQPAERKFKKSRQMLEVILELGFPVFILERSPLVLRDLDLLRNIEQRAKAVVAFSIISTPDSPGYPQVCQIENLAPSAEKRFAAMEKIAKEGILTGTCFMPVLPGLCDDEQTIANIVRWTANHGGQFVLTGGLTLADQQRQYFFKILGEHFPDLLGPYQHLFPAGSYGPKAWKWKEVALQIQEKCQHLGIHDRIPRPIIQGEKRARNKRVVEALAYKVYNMDLNNRSQNQVWAYRRAAWAIEDLEQDIGLIYSIMGKSGLENIPNVGAQLAQEIEQILHQVSEDQPNLELPQKRTQKE